MANIWVYAVGGVVALGAAVALYDAIGSRNAPARASQPAPASDSQVAQASAPRPEATFDNIEITKDDFIIGKADAPVTMIEYASLTCPHCAHFHNDILPAIKKEFIETGKVRMIYRDYPLDQLALTGSILARCAGPDRYFPFISVLFDQQKNWARASNPLTALARLARLGGMSQAEFEACLKNKEVADSVLQQRLDGQKSFQIGSTPTIIINGQKFSGALSVDQFRAVVAPMLK
jgi:protein-disulfide isomerase